MTAVLIPTQLPERVVALGEAAVAEVAAARAKLARIEAVTDEIDLELAEAAYRAAHELKKRIEASRAEVKAPVLDLGRRIDEAAKAAVAPLSAEQERVGAMIATFREEMKREAAEAEKERKRLERERQAAAEAAQREAMATGAPLPPEPPPVAVAPPPKLAPSAVAVKSKQVLRINDASLIPREVGGVVCLVPDERAIKKLLEAGVVVPGCDLVTETKIGATGR